MNSGHHESRSLSGEHTRPRVCREAPSPRGLLARFAGARTARHISGPSLRPQRLCGVLSALALLAAVPLWAQDEALELPVPPPPMEEGFSEPPQGLPPLERMLNIMKQRNPEEFARLTKLRAEDPEAFRAELARKVADVRRRMGPERPGGGWQGSGERGRPEGGPVPRSPELDAAEERIRELVKAWRKAADRPDEQAALRGTLLTALGEVFDLREAARREQVEKMREHLTRAQAMLDQRATNRAAIIEKRLKDLTGADGMEW